MSDDELILFNQWLATEDCKSLFTQWKNREGYNVIQISNKRRPPPPPKNPGRTGGKAPKKLKKDDEVDSRLSICNE